MQILLLTPASAAAFLEHQNNVRLRMRDDTFQNETTPKAATNVKTADRSKRYVDLMFGSSFSCLLLLFAGNSLRLAF